MAGASTNQQLAASVQDAVRTLQKCLGQARLYYTDHPTTLQFLEQFVQKINLAADMHGGVVLKAAFEGLSWKGVQLTQEDEEHKGLGYMLTTEGIEELVFRSGLDFDEAYILLTMLQMNYAEEEETLEGLMWQANLAHVQLRGLKALAESEALSAAVEDIEQAKEQEARLKKQVHHSPNRERNLKAMADANPGGEEEVDPDYEATGDSEYEVPDPGERTPVERFWQEYFEATKEEDAFEIDLMCEEITSESKAPLLMRALSILLMSGVMRRPEVQSRDLMKISAGVTSQLFGLEDLSVVREVIVEEQQLRARIPANNAQALQFLDLYCEDVIPPARVADLLVNLDYSDPNKARIARELMANMPIEGLLKTMEWGASYEYGPLLPFFQAFCQTVGQKVVTHVLSMNMAEVRVKVLISLIRVIRAAGLKDDRYKQVRVQLVRHFSGEVRVEALRWYADVEFDHNDLDVFMAALTDTSDVMRQAATEALRVRRPPILRPALERVISERFERFVADQKRSVCLAYAYVADDGALPVLKDLLMEKLPLFGDDPKANDTIEAAAMALVAMNNPRARDLVERQARGLIPGARKEICRRVLMGAGEEVEA